MIPDPLRFAIDVLEARGALVEVAPEDERATVLLPPVLAASLGVPEALTLAREQEAEGAVSCGMGTPLLEQLVGEEKAVVPVGAFALALASPRPAQLEAAVERLVVRNGLAEVMGTSPTTGLYVWAAMAWVAEADDRYEGLVHLFFDAATGRTPDEGVRALVDPRGPRGMEAARAPVLEPLRGAPGMPAEAAQWIVRRAEAAVRREVEPILESVARRQERDRDRIVEYFGALIAEAGAERPGRTVAAEAVRAKLAQLRAERDAKLADLGPRYALRVSVVPAALLLVRVPAITVELRLRRRKGVRELTTQLPAGARMLDQLVCEACGGSTPRPLLCDERLHVLCEVCVPAAEGRPRCPACRRGRGRG